jgi:hypothetical protein
MFQHPHRKRYFSHFKELKKASEDYLGLEYATSIVLHAARIFFPGFRFGFLTNNYKTKNRLLEWYILLKVMFLFYLLMSQTTSDFVLFVAIYFLCDVVHHLFSRIFSHIPGFRKNFVHLVLNMAEIVLGYALLYDHLSLIWVDGIPSHNPLDILYFSTVTFATVGYGDIGALNSLARIIVASQISVSVLFIVIICSSFVSEMTHKKSS